MYQGNSNKNPPVLHTMGITPPAKERMTTDPRVSARSMIKGRSDAIWKTAGAGVDAGIFTRRISSRTEAAIRI